MSYLQSVARRVAASALSRAVTDMWRSRRTVLPAPLLQARLHEELGDRAGLPELESFRALGAAAREELAALVAGARLLELDGARLVLRPDGVAGPARALQDPAELEQVLVHIGELVARRSAGG